VVFMIEVVDFGHYRPGVNQALPFILGGIS
jgi:hypothetical protein